MAEMRSSVKYDGYAYRMRIHSTPSMVAISCSRLARFLPSCEWECTPLQR